MYGKLNNGVLEFAPQNYKLSDGRLIVGFNKSEALMKRYGFKEVVDNQPEFNVENEFLVISGYTETETNIIINYTIKEMTTIEELDSIETKINQLKETDTEHEEALAELTEMILSITGGLE